MTKYQIFTWFSKFCVFISNQTWLVIKRCLGWEQGWNQIFFLSNFSKLFNCSAIFVPLPFCQFVRIWSLFLSILIALKYLQPNFEVWCVNGSLSVGLIPTVLKEAYFWKVHILYLVPFSKITVFHLFTFEHFNLFFMFDMVYNLNSCKKSKLEISFEIKPPVGLRMLI